MDNAQQGSIEALQYSVTVLQPLPWQDLSKRCSVSEAIVVSTLHFFPGQNSPLLNHSRDQFNLDSEHRLDCFLEGEDC